MCVCVCVVVSVCVCMCMEESVCVKGRCELSTSANSTSSNIQCYLRRTTEDQAH